MSNLTEEQRAWNALADEKVEKTFKEFDRSWNSFYRGLLTEGELNQRLFNVLGEGFWDFLHDYGIYLNFSAAKYPSFLEGLRAFREGKALPDSEPVPWLTIHSYPWRKAAAEDGRRFFYLLTRYNIPPEFFESVPEHILAPKRKEIHGYHDLCKCCAVFDVVDDGGLLACEDAAGKTFFLREEDGLEVKLSVIEDNRNRDWGGEPGWHPDFVAEGYIEGYTVKGQRTYPKMQVYLTKDNKKIDYIAYDESLDDLSAFRHFPLWEEYFDWCVKHGEEQTKMVRALSKRGE